MKAPRPAEVYLRFLQLPEADLALPPLPPLDTLEERILAWVARATQERQPLAVRDMLGKGELGKPTTVHARLQSMRKKGWIVLVDTDDAQRQQIELTQQALAHFARLSRAPIKPTKG